MHPKHRFDELMPKPGRTRFERLIHIGTTSTHLYLEALKAAVAEAKKGQDVGRYEIAVAALAEILPHDDDAIRDDDWAETTKKRAKTETDKMELELKGYKNNLIKESIRVRGHSVYVNLGKTSDSLSTDGLPRFGSSLSQHRRPSQFKQVLLKNAGLLHHKFSYSHLVNAPHNALR